VSLGAILALLVLICALVLALIGRLDYLEAGLFGALALAILLGGILVPWQRVG